jgi:CheY-like chemotaxis protein
VRSAQRCCSARIIGGLECFADTSFFPKESTAAAYTVIMSKPRILIVDDDKNISKLMAILLEKTGRYQVRTENKSMAAYAVAQEFCPDLCLFDVDMPGKDGGTLARELRADPALFADTDHLPYSPGLTRRGRLHADGQRRISLSRQVRGYQCAAKLDRFADASQRALLSRSRRLVFASPG